MRNYQELQVHDLYGSCLAAPLRTERTGKGTYAIFAERLQFDLRLGFPLMTSKFVPFQSVLSELLWFVEGSGDERRLAEILHGTRDSSKTTIWTDNATASYWIDKAKFEGDLGRVYGVQWRAWKTGRHVPTPDADGHIWHLEETVDQLAQVIDKIRTNPTDRRIIMTAWNPGELDQMALPPCHMFCQFFVSEGHLDLLMYQRSVDTFLGLPFNIASYATLQHMVAHVTGLKPRMLTLDLGDTHIYANHVDQVKLLLTREPRDFPTLKIIGDVKEIDDFAMSNFHLDGYNPHAAIKAQMAV